MSGLTPADISTAFLYDQFTPFVIMQLEELGLCDRGEAKDFATVERLSLGGEFPINTSGGLLGEAYIHGMNAGTGVPTSRAAAQRRRAGRERPGHDALFNHGADDQTVSRERRSCSCGSRRWCTCRHRRHRGSSRRRGHRR